MGELQTIRRITIYADASLESFLIEQAMNLGSKGYTATTCRGRGKHEVMEDPMTGVSLVRIEFLVQPEVADKIMDYLAQPEFRRRAVSACTEAVQVLTAEHF